MQPEDDASRHRQTGDALPAFERSETTRGEDALTRDIEALLATFQNRLLARDFDALEALMTEDFTYVELNGATLDRTTLLDRERRGAGSKPSTEIHHRLLSATSRGASAEAMIELQFRTVITRGSSRVVYEGRGRERVTLAREASGWRFRTVVIEAQELTRNGQAAGEEVIEEMHRGA